MMDYRKLHMPGRSAMTLACAALLALALPAISDIVDTIDEGPLSGEVTLAQGDAALRLTDTNGKAKPINLIDLDRVRFNVDQTNLENGKLLLIDNDKGQGTHRTEAKIKLRAGLHRITIPYWHDKGGHTLTVNVSGAGVDGQTTPGSKYLFCFRNSDAEEPAAKGIDDQGFRLPELALNTADDRRLMLTRARYRLYTSPEGTGPISVQSLGFMQLKRSGTTSMINTGMLNEHNENVGLVFDAFFKAEKDGEYHFILHSMGGSQLHFGQVESFTSNTLSDPAVHTPCRADLVNDGVALGELKTISDETMTFHIPLVSDATIALSHTRAVWLVNGGLNAINRDNEPTNEDTVYLRDKNKPEEVRSVSGKISGLDQDNLTFVFRGEERTIARDRVVGLVFKHASRPAPPTPGMYQVIELKGGQILPANIKSIDKHVSFEILGGSTVTPPRDVVRAMRIENGRRIDLTRLSPNAEEAVPYFGLKLPHKVNTDFSGKPIMLYDGKTYERGLSVHSKSRLHYKLKPNCQRFQATFGLLNPGGKLGNVTARILGDGEVLWEQEDITEATKPIQIDVPLKGVERLILEVDFGKGQDVGDRAAWANPRLIYAGGGEASP